MANSKKDPRSGAGYRTPPPQHQFPRGVSGNPRGRPKKRQTVGDKFEAALSRTVTIRDGDGQREIAVLDGIIHAAIASALRGNLRAIDLVLRLFERFRDDAATTLNPKELSASDRKTLDNYMKRVQAGIAARKPAASSNSDHKGD
jgi:hypothetical protein